MGTARRVRPLTLDAGALVAVERNDRSVQATIRAAIGAGLNVTIPAAVLAQVWRDGSRQAELARLLKQGGVTVADLNEDAAKASGELCGRTGTHDVVDASVVVCARTRGRGAVVTGDPADLGRLDPSLDLQRV